MLWCKKYVKIYVVYRMEKEATSALIDIDRFSRG